VSVAAEVIGWAGAGCLLLAYYLVSSHRVAAAGAAYQLLNLAGAAGLTVNAVVHHAWPSAALNLLWAAIGIAALARASRSPGPRDADRR
jgi:hypothetical protein